MAEPQQPLQGIKVVEIGTSVAAPYAGWILAGLGAEVIKIENPKGGDDARQWGRMFPDGRSSFFLAINSNKKSVTLDLRNEADRDWLLDFCAEKADVVLQNMRPGQRSAELRPRCAGLSVGPPTQALIYCNMGAFGARGTGAGQARLRPLDAGLRRDHERDRRGRTARRCASGSPSWIWVRGSGAPWASYPRLLQPQGRPAAVASSIARSTRPRWLGSANQAAMVQVDGRNPEKVGSGARGMAPYQAYRLRRRLPRRWQRRTTAFSNGLSHCAGSPGMAPATRASTAIRSAMPTWPTSMPCLDADLPRGRDPRPDLGGTLLEEPPACPAPRCVSVDGDAGRAPQTEALGLLQSQPGGNGPVASSACP